jgi:C-terminal processing protease CtpA/Prc
MLIKDYKLGKIIGQETGGTPTCYGDHFDFELPNTKTKVRVSYKWSLRPSGVDDNRGVIPDIILDPTLEDILLEKDREMDYVLNLIKEKNNK